jgi:hypothetical protein
LKYQVDIQAPEPENVYIAPKINIDIAVGNMITEYDPSYCDDIISHASQGKSVESFGGKKYIDPDKMIEWCNNYPEFKSAVKIAFSAELLWWESLAETARDNIPMYKDLLPTINRKLSQLENSLMKNGLRMSMFGYKELSEQEKMDKKELEAMKLLEEYTS